MIGYALFLVSRTSICPVPTVLHTSIHFFAASRFRPEHADVKVISKTAQKLHNTTIFLESRLGRANT